MIYEELIKVFDIYEKISDITPIAHTSVKVDIEVYIDTKGNFLGAQILNKRRPIPCTIQSEGRTSNIAPHLIYDNLGYLTGANGKEKQHEAYKEQIMQYIKATGDKTAMAVYRYLQKGLLCQDISFLTKQMNHPLNMVFVIFTIPSISESTTNPLWTEYYYNTLPKNGMCSITGEIDHIPDSYPKSIRFPSDFARAFIGKQNALDNMPQLAPGYIATQKIVHAMQWLIYDGPAWGKEYREEISEKLKSFDTKKEELNERNIQKL